MITIDFNYKRFGITRNARFEAPQRWNEMNEEQFLLLAHQAQGAIIPEQKFFRVMFGAPKYLVRRLDPWYKYVLERKANYLRDKKAMSNHFFIQKIGKLYAPMDMLMGVSLQQFMQVDTFYEKAANELGTAVTPNLDMMVASLYLKKNQSYSVEENDRKHKLVDTDENLRIVSKVGQDKKWAIYMNWTMIKNWLSKAYSLVFPVADEEQSKNNPQKATPWLEIFDNFVGDDIAHAEAYKTMESTDAFRIMQHRVKEYQLGKLRSKGYAK